MDLRVRTLVLHPAEGFRERGVALSLYDDNGNGRITCAEARRHGIAPVPRTHPAYQYMRDGDGDKIRDLLITTPEATGTITAPTTTTTNVSNLNIRIQDATGDEDDGYLVFRVRLSRKYTDYVCYDFETIPGGTATEGLDYSKRPKVGQWMQIGKRVDQPFVRIIDDSENDDGETVKVKISNARLCDDASQTVSITTAEATGTIRNSDPLPQALMARFGRTAAVHVVEHVEERLAAPRNVGVEAQVAGRQLRPGMEREMALDFLSQLGSSAGMHAPGAGSPGARSGSPMGAATGSLGLAAGMGGPAGGGMGLAADPMNGMAGPAGGLFDQGLSSMGLGGGESAHQLVIRAHPRDTPWRHPVVLEPGRPVVVRRPRGGTVAGR